jgi:tetratricopeptide (TPR) repeat protein
MKMISLTRWAILVALGFFLGCSNTLKTVESLVQEQAYFQALKELEEGLEKRPENEQLWLEQGRIHLIYSETDEPIQRTYHYKTAYFSFEEAQRLGVDSTQNTEIDNLLQSYWTQEHNAGIRALESGEYDDRLRDASSHLRNAVELKPNEISSYIALSNSYYSAVKIKLAFKTLRDAEENLDTPNAQIYEKLGFLSLEQGDIEESITFYQRSIEIADNKNAAFGLVNAYILSGESLMSVELLSSLLERYPNDTEINHVYGVQLNIVLDGYLTQLHQAYKDDNSKEIERLREAIALMMEGAEGQLTQAYQNDISNTAFVESLAIFYNNLTSKYLEMLEVAYTEHVDPMSDSAAEYLDKAITYYMRLQQLRPNHPEYSQKAENLGELRIVLFTY